MSESKEGEKEKKESINHNNEEKVFGDSQYVSMSITETSHSFDPFDEKNETVKGVYLPKNKKKRNYDYSGFRRQGYNPRRQQNYHMQQQQQQQQQQGNYYNPNQQQYQGYQNYSYNNPYYYYQGQHAPPPAGPYYQPHYQQHHQQHPSSSPPPYHSHGSEKLSDNYYVGPKEKRGGYKYQRPFKKSPRGGYNSGGYERGGGDYNKVNQTRIEDLDSDDEDDNKEFVRVNKIMKKDKSGIDAKALVSGINGVLNQFNSNLRKVNRRINIVNKTLTEKIDSVKGYLQDNSQRLGHIYHIATIQYVEKALREIYEDDNIYIKDTFLDADTLQTQKNFSDRFVNPKSTKMTKGYEEVISKISENNSLSYSKLKMPTKFVIMDAVSVSSDYTYIVRTSISPLQGFNGNAVKKLQFQGVKTFEYYFLYNCCVLEKQLTCLKSFEKLRMVLLIGTHVKKTKFYQLGMFVKNNQAIFPKLFEAQRQNKLEIIHSKQLHSLREILNDTKDKNVVRNRGEYRNAGKETRFHKKDKE